MPLKIVGRRKEVGSDDRKFIEGKIERLRKLVSGISVMDVFVDEFKSQATVNIVIKAGPIELNAKDTDKTVRSAFDRVLEKIERGIKRTKSKKWGGKRQRRQSSRLVQLSNDPHHLASANAEEEAGEQQIIAIERVPFKPMSVEEAAEQIEVNQSRILVFTNDVSERINVIYRRDDGHFGLIEPR